MANLQLKNHLRESHLFSRRALLAAAVVLGLMMLLVARLTYLQVFKHAYYLDLSQQNQVTLVPLPPPRGLILDRNGVVLARNQPTFALEVTPSKTDDMAALLDALSQVVTIDARDRKRFQREVQQKHAFEAIPLRFKLKEDEVARLAVEMYRFPAASITPRLAREYPMDALGVHAVGYVGRINAQEQKKIDAANYKGTTHIGKVGIEHAYEDTLHGALGYEAVETTAHGEALRVLSRTPPVAGKNIYLTLDARLQAVAEGAFTGRRGALVALRPDTGEILAFVSQPAYDPNLFVNGIEPEDYDALANSPDHPLNNRALRGVYPPGSTIKPFFGLAGLEHGIMTPEQRVFCGGGYRVGNGAHVYRDWKREGHGPTDLTAAIEQSCDVYFYTLAVSLGIDRLAQFMRSLGMGQKTGVDLNGESKGLVPSPEWKKKTYKQPWYLGETVVTGIGQGYTLVTPMQLATLTAALAARGVQMRPHLLGATQSPDGKDFQPQVSTVVRHWPLNNPQHYDTVINGMIEVMHGARGTATASVRDATYRVAGKTGTAQVFSLKGENYKESEVAERLRDHALFVAFAPAQAPQIALAVIVENGGHGGSVAAPIARQVMDYYLLQVLPHETQRPPVHLTPG